MPDADVYFKTKHQPLGAGQKLVLSGDIPELGCWHDDYAVEAVPLEPVGEELYLVIIKLPMNKTLKWKWAIADDDSKVQRWEDCPNRHLTIDRKLILIYAPWNGEAKIMDPSVRAYEFVPAYVLFDSSWQKSLPKRRIYEPSTSQESSSPDSKNIPTLNKEMRETREKMIELQRKWSQSDRKQSMEDFLQSGLKKFREEKAKCNGKTPNVCASSPRKVQFKEKPNIAGGTYLSSSPPKDSRGNRQRPERPKSAKVRKQLAQASEQTSTALSSSPPRTDGQTTVYENLDHVEGEKTRRDNFCEEERLKEDEDADKTDENTDPVIIEMSPIPSPGESQRTLMYVTGAVGCAILLFLGYYAYRKMKT